MTEIMRRPVRIRLLLLVMVALATAWVSPAFAQEGDRDDGQIVFGRNVDLEAGQVIDGGLVIFGGNLSMAANSRIRGDLAVFGGNTEIAGDVHGDVAVIGGNIYLAPSARVDGDIFCLGGRVQKDSGAQVTGKQTDTGRLELGRFFPRLSEFRFAFAPPRWGGFDAVSAVWHLMRAVLVSLAVAVVGLLVVLFLPEHAAVVGRTITGAAAPSFGVGLLTLFLGAALIAVLFFTICLAPIGLLLGLPLALASLLGWAVVGYLLGQRLMPVLSKEATPAPTVTALVGVLVLTAVQQGLMVLGEMPCFGFLLWFAGAGMWLVVTSLGLGAVVLSRFGTQPYPGPTPPLLPHPSAPPKDAAPPPEPAPTEHAGPPQERKPAGPAPAPAAEKDAPPEAPAAPAEGAPPAQKKPRRRPSRRRERDLARPTEESPG